MKFDETRPILTQFLVVTKWITGKKQAKKRTKRSVFFYWALFAFPEVIEQFRNEVKSLNTQIIAIANQKGGGGQPPARTWGSGWRRPGRKCC
jgi:hypothetical protein